MISLKLPGNEFYRARCPVGFSWTLLFFGFFVPLFRGDAKWAFIMLLVTVVTLLISPPIILITQIILAACYNSAYVKDFLKKGYIPADENSKNILITRNLIETTACGT